MPRAELITALPTRKGSDCYEKLRNPGFRQPEMAENHVVSAQFPTFVFSGWRDKVLCAKGLRRGIPI
jgi:hypothetical protein